MGKQQKTSRLNLRLTPKEEEAYRREAAELDMSLSDYIRTALEQYHNNL